MRCVGVDPGAYGALSLIANGQLIRVDDMPIIKIRRDKTDKAEVDGYTLASVLREMAPDILFLEQVGGITGQSASAAFNFGRAAGAVEYAAKALGIRVELVPPGTWKRAMKLNPGKDAARAMAMRMWPERADLFKRVKDADRAEACLIAEWGRKQIDQPAVINAFD